MYNLSIHCPSDHAGQMLDTLSGYCSSAALQRPGLASMVGSSHPRQHNLQARGAAGFSRPKVDSKPRVRHDSILLDLSLRGYRSWTDSEPLEGVGSAVCGTTARIEYRAKFLCFRSCEWLRLV